MFHPRGPSLLELARQALSSTDRGYELLAEKFDFTPYRTPAFVLEAVGAVLDELGPFETGIDLCTGTGAGLSVLRPRCTRRLVGIDRVPAMLAIAERNLTERTLAEGSVVESTPSPELVVGDVLSPPFEANGLRGAFDVATCFGAFGHIEREDEARFCLSVLEMLRPGGRFVFPTSTRPGPLERSFWLAHGFNVAMRVRNAVLRPPFIMYYLTFTLPEVKDLLEDAGFSVEVKPLRAPARPATRLQMVVATKPA